MADLAAGISKTVIQELANKVETAMKKEEELWRIVHRDTLFMKEEFEMMKSFLKTSDWGRIKNNVMRTWVRQVRDLSYDAEDCIESIILLDTKRSVWTVCRRMIASSCYVTLCNLVAPCCCLVAPSQLDLAVAEIKLLKARVEEVSNRNLRYNLIDDSSSKPITPQLLASVSAVGTTAVDVLKKAWCDAKELGAGFVDLTMLVTEENDALRAISVWGPEAHLGMMTSIIKEAYEDEKIRQTFKFRVWLKLAHPFNPNVFIRSLEHEFYRNFPEDKDGGVGVDVPTEIRTAQGTNLVEEFVQKLNNYKSLIILEDLSSMADWHAVRAFLPNRNKNGSRIVVSTQQIEIARWCIGNTYRVLELQKLPDNQSICVFFNKAFKRVKEVVVEGGQSLMAPEGPLVGRSSDEDKLLNLIITSAGRNDRHVISVWGFPGLGKSTLVRKVCSRIVGSTSQSFEWYGWGEVSYPFKLGDLCEKMLSFTTEKSTQYRASMTMPQPSKSDEGMIDDFAEYLRAHRCLIVIKGLKSKGDWDLIKAKLAPESSKSCIVVITTEESLAKHCAVHEDAMYGARALGSNAALELFRKKFLEKNSCWGAYLQKEAKYILAKCGGIPTVIMALAEYLGTQQGDIWQQKLDRLKANFMHELETNPEFARLRDLIFWMHVNFNNLPRSLEACTLYLSVFPQANIVRRNRFVCRWIAEGYSKCTDSKTAEEYAGELFDSRRATWTATVAEWQANSFFQEYINSRLMEECVVLFPLVVSILSEENCSLATERLGQHLTIRRDWQRDRSVFDDFDLSVVQSLTVAGEWKSFFIPDKLRSLRVLDLEGADGVPFEELRNILKKLPRLRFLSLRGHGEINSLPDSLYKLRLLQTLDIRDTCVTRLPSSIVKLQSLQYVRAGTTVPWMVNGREISKPTRCGPLASLYCLSKFFIGDAGRVAIEVPRKIGNLSKLHTLGAVKANTASGAAILNNLEKLIIRLRKLELYGISHQNSRKLSSIFNSGTQLEDLTLWLDQQNKTVPWDDIRCLCNLRSLKLYGGHVKLLPTEIMYLHKLKKLSFQMISLTEDDIHCLGRLKDLQTLRLRAKTVQAYQLQFCARTDDADGGTPTPDQFPNLNVLEIACCSRLHIKFGERAVASLKEIKLCCCNGLTCSGLEYPPSLGRVCLHGSYDNTLKMAVKQQLDRHEKKPCLELEEPRPGNLMCTCSA